VLLVAGAIGACSGSVTGVDAPNTSGFGTPDAGTSATTDGGGGTFPTLLAEAGPVEEAGIDAGPVSCTPALPATFTPVWNRPLKSAACSADDLAGYHDACTPYLNGASCTSWVAAHTGCAACLQPTDNSGPIQTYRDRLYFTLNIAGCISLAEASDSCAKPYDAFYQCLRQSCDACFEQARATYPDFQACQTKSATASCSSYNTTKTSACVGVKNAGGAPQCFPTADEAAAMASGDAATASAASRSHFIRVEGIFCGP
jgi:hypothetical protein